MNLAVKIATGAAALGFAYLLVRPRSVPTVGWGRPEWKLKENPYG